MDIMHGLFGQTFVGSYEQSAQYDALHQNAMAAFAANAQIRASLGEANYRPPVIVPGGWAYWYSVAQELP
jgi:hypothetical protein